MQEAIINMRKLSQQAQIIENSTQSNDVDFLFDLNEHQYELQRHILCHPCCVSIQTVGPMKKSTHPNKNNNNISK